MFLRSHGFGCLPKDWQYIFWRRLPHATRAYLANVDIVFGGFIKAVSPGAPLSTTSGTTNKTGSPRLRPSSPRSSSLINNDPTGTGTICCSKNISSKYSVFIYKKKSFLSNNL